MVNFNAQIQQNSLGVAVATDDVRWASNLIDLGARANSDHLAQAISTGSSRMVSRLIRDGATFNNACAARVLGRLASGCLANAFLPQALTITVSAVSINAAVDALSQACSPAREAFAHALLSRLTPDAMARSIRSLCEQGNPVALRHVLSLGAALTTKPEPAASLEPLRTPHETLLDTPLEVCFERGTAEHACCAVLLINGGCELKTRRLKKNGLFELRGSGSVASLPNLLRSCDALGWESVALEAAEAARWPACIFDMAHEWTRLPTFAQKVQLSRLVAEPVKSRARPRSL